MNKTAQCFPPGIQHTKSRFLFLHLHFACFSFGHFFSSSDQMCHVFFFWSFVKSVVFQPLSNMLCFYVISTHSSSSGLSVYFSFCFEASIIPRHLVFSFISPAQIVFSFYGCILLRCLITSLLSFFMTVENELTKINSTSLQAWGHFTFTNQIRKLN